MVSFTDATIISLWLVSSKLLFPFKGISPTPLYDLSFLPPINTFYKQASVTATSSLNSALSACHDFLCARVSNPPQPLNSWVLHVLKSEWTTLQRSKVLGKNPTFRHSWLSISHSLPGSLLPFLQQNSFFSEISRCTVSFCIQIIFCSAFYP